MKRKKGIEEYKQEANIEFDQFCERIYNLLSSEIKPESLKEVLVGLDLLIMTCRAIDRYPAFLQMMELKKQSLDSKK